MLCEKYKPALIEAAITGADLPPAVRAHTDSCAHCTTELAEQRSLIAAIDTNLHRQMNAPVPASMLHRLAARLAQQPQPKRAPRFAQIFAGTFATLVAAAMILLFLPHWRIAILPRNAKVNVVPTRNASASQIQVHIGPSSQTVVAKGLPSQTLKHVNIHATRVTEANTSTTIRSEPEVLVPPDERIALAHFIANSSTGRELITALNTSLRRNPDQPVKHIDIPDLNTPGIVIEPIAEETRR
jgi:hypothetical protein